ncbi:MAG: hypothetical protein EOP56_16740 [Sphingobacteriales bacterium]|nr:MAG: hypothetical protein EOP56_16740 [Sphingobacteriales bacterium]
MKHHRHKSQNALKRMKVKPTVSLDRSEMDKRVFDLVLKTLYNSANRSGLHIENEIFAPSKVKIAPHETGRLWEVMISSGWVSPVIGFGNAGKLELTKAGYQFMATFGGYSEYLTSVANSQQQPQTIILPIQVQAEEEHTMQPATQELPAPAEVGKVAHKNGRKKRRAHR